jgi:hypothetical protein
MALRALLAAAAATAIAVGLILPALHGRAEPKSQIEQIEVGRS